MRTSAYFSPPGHGALLAVIDGSSATGYAESIGPKGCGRPVASEAAQYRYAQARHEPDNSGAASTEEAMTFDRITVKPDKLEGKPCIRGLRIAVESVVRLVAAGWSFDQILEEYPDLEHADIQQALEYAAAATDVHEHGFAPQREAAHRREAAATVGGTTQRSRP